MSEAMNGYSEVVVTTPLTTLGLASTSAPSLTAPEIHVLASSEPMPPRMSSMQFAIA
eukprot:CAMPEP_0171507392 /NCGR_PEP_ID=MMETSP0958-20121227/13499_1 /TAXON_ID=87120 /ORGANISM="Aurantiochytrium limacinum, Strain ATCCMYA-1381" /LENGTH=56 /DNA_ID=CAMNT_0012044135 /DNA_START=84 /DNA_END=254 /DNA_ORIENTATION=+